jgi:hypothetical protein
MQPDIHLYTRVAMDAFQAIPTFTQSASNVGYELIDCKACERGFIGSEQIGNLPAIKGIISWWQEVQYQ